jgi:tetratricopeptide (TPR) repeat protein/class 3 adenylate cyclase
MTTVSPDSDRSSLGNASAAARWAMIETLMHGALDREPSARAQFLAGACPDSALRNDVDALLHAHDQSGMLDLLSEAVMKPLLVRSDRPNDAAAPAFIAATPPELERYRIIEKLGGGGMGVVYRARDERLDRDVALKFLPPHQSADEAAKKRFLVEARAAASLEHPNICTVHEIGETRDGQLYIVMACYDGRTLATRIASGPLPVEEALRIALEVAQGLAKAHERRIVHRDVKPANIMLTGDGLVKILDFGIAKLSDMNVTQTPAVIGTLSYMSPEQAFGEMVDTRTDIWALGVVLYEMLAGRRPFRGPNAQAVLYSILTARLEPIGLAHTYLAPGIDAFLRRALAKKPEDRFASAREMLVELSDLYSAARASASGAAQDASAADAAAHGALTTESLLTLAGERRRAAVAVTAVADHAALVERLTAAELDTVLNAIREIATDVCERHGGIVNHFAGEESVLLFGVAASHEDDSLRAVRAVLELHARVRALPPAGASGMRVRMRSGVHTGALVAQRLRTGDRRFRVIGAPLDVGRGLAANAGSDALLLSPETQRLVAPFVETEPLAPLTLQPTAAPVIPHRVTGTVAISTRLEIAERTDLTPFAERSRELESLEELVAAAEGGDGGFAIVLGDPGAGKSRLLWELRRRVMDSEAQLVMGRCDAYGGATPYIPFVQVIRELLELGTAPTVVTAAQVAEKVRAVDASLADALPLYCALLSVECAANPLPRHLQGEHLQTAMLEALAALVTLQARRRPLVLLLEDWHWSDEASRRALEQLAEIAPAHRLLLVVTCRPDSGIEWSSTERGLLLRLRPLSLDGSTAIVSGVLKAERVAGALAQQLHARTGGNPFFLEEICEALLEQQLVVVRDGEAAANEAMAHMRLPETVQAVIRTRLDRLTPDSRDTIRVASVIGREFSRAVLDELMETELDDGRQLGELRRAGLIEQTSVAPEPAYRFKHALTQEVAYDTLLEHQRETLHARAAAAVETRYADRLDEHRERLAHHLSRAGQWAEAVQHGIHAADRALGLSQFADALAMLDRTRAWVERVRDRVRRRELLIDMLFRQERLCETLGNRARQITIVGELIALLAPHPGSRQLAEAYLRQGDISILLRRFDDADRSLGTAMRVSLELGDRAGERNAARSYGLLRSYEGRYEEAVEAFKRAHALDLELGETSAAAGDVASLGNVLRKMGRPHEAIEALERVGEHLTLDDDTTKWCAIRTVIACAHRDLGDDVTALRYLEEVRAVAIERRLPILVAFCLPAIAHIQLQRGDVEEGLATYRRAAELSRRARHADGLALALRALGEVLLGLRRFAEAVPNLREAADIFAQLEDRDTESLIWQRLATAYEQCGRVTDAHELWEKLQRRCEDAGDAAGESVALEGVARCARARGVRSAAIQLYERALTRAAPADHVRESTLRNTLGLLHWEEGSYDDALRQYRAALRLCREQGDQVHEGLILNSLGATLLKLRRHDEALAVLEDAARVNAGTGERRLEAHSYAVLGDSLFETGRSAEARLAFERSLYLRPSLGDRRGEGWMHARIGRALLAEGQTKDARVALDAARTIAGEIEDAELTATLERMWASDVWGTLDGRSGIRA